MSGIGVRWNFAGNLGSDPNPVISPVFIETVGITANHHRCTFQNDLQVMLETPNMLWSPSR